MADRCCFEFPFGKPQFPAFAPPDGSTPAQFLRKLVGQGLRRRYPDRFAQLESQVEEELTIIGEVGYKEYFLAVWDILQACRQRGIDWIYAGSGGFAGLLLSVHQRRAIRFDLYFRRFLNQERMLLQQIAGHRH